MHLLANLILELSVSRRLVGQVSGAMIQAGVLDRQRDTSKCACTGGPGGERCMLVPGRCCLCHPKKKRGPNCQ